MSVSVVISTRNAAATLEACLKSLKQQNYDDMEIIIADNFSTDNTREIGQRNGAIVLKCGPRPPHNNYFTGPIQKKLGTLRASGEFIFLVDADMILEPGLMEECLELFEMGAQAIAVPEVSFGTGFWSSCKVAERKCYFEPTLADWAIQACRFFERSTFKSIGGWDGVVGVFDDWDLVARLRSQGRKISRSRRCIFHNEGRLTLRRIIIKKYEMGKVGFLKRYMSSGGKSFSTISDQLTPFRIIRMLGKLPKVCRDPRVISGVVFLKTVEGLAFLSGSLSRPKNYDLELVQD
jgi:glycosyltransferase involved in cell wall biosynthesis